MEKQPEAKICNQTTENKCNAIDALSFCAPKAVAGWQDDVCCFSLSKLSENLRFKLVDASGTLAK